MTQQDSTVAVARSPRARFAAGTLIAALAFTLAACGGSKEDEAVADVPPSRSEAARFLTQATFGPNQRYLSKGAYLVPLSPPGEPKWIVPGMPR